jgi:hypothetical protein
MKLSWRTTTAVAVALLATVAGCGGDETEADPLPPTPSTTSPTPSSTETTPAAPAGWEDDFTEDQLRAYDAALIRWQRYIELTNEIYRKGKDTPEARAVLKGYNLLWQRDIVTLAQTYDEGGLRLEVPSMPLWTMAKSVDVTKDGAGTVFITQCTDYSQVRYTRNGKVLKNKPRHLVTPLTIHMTKPDGHGWMFAGSTLKDKSSCAAA